MYQFKVIIYTKLPKQTTVQYIQLVFKIPLTITLFQNLNVSYDWIIRMYMFDYIS